MFSSGVVSSLIYLAVSTNSSSQCMHDLPFIRHAIMGLFFFLFFNNYLYSVFFFFFFFFFSCIFTKPRLAYSTGSLSFFFSLFPLLDLNFACSRRSQRSRPIIAYMYVRTYVLLFKSPKADPMCYDFLLGREFEKSSSRGADR